MFKGSYAQKGLSSETEIPSLCETYKDYFSIGVAISPKKSFDSKAKEVIKKHFNSITLSLNNSEDNETLQQVIEYTKPYNTNHKITEKEPFALKHH